MLLTWYIDFTIACLNAQFYIKNPLAHSLLRLPRLWLVDVKASRVGWRGVLLSTFAAGPRFSLKASSLQYKSDYSYTTVTYLIVVLSAVLEVFPSRTHTY